MKTNTTLDFYNNNAETYVENTAKVDFTELYQRFLSHIKKGDKILDVGAGSGRDSLYFIKNGYQVTAIDPSQKLAEIASKVIGQEVLVVKAEDMTFEKEFQAVWAMSSLLHLNDEQLEKAIVNIKNSMVDGGYLWASFRNNSEALTDSKGRFFNGFSLEKIASLFSPHFDNLEVMVQGDSMGRDVSWIELGATKKPELKLQDKDKSTKKKSLGLK